MQRLSNIRLVLNSDSRYRSALVITLPYGTEKKRYLLDTSCRYQHCLTS